MRYRSKNPSKTCNSFRITIKHKNANVNRNKYTSQLKHSVNENKYIYIFQYQI